MTCQDVCNKIEQQNIAEMPDLADLATLYNYVKKPINFIDTVEKTGVFTAPKSGLYYFSTHALREDRKRLFIGLKKNDDILCSFQEENKSDGEDGTGSCSAIVELSLGKNYS